MPDPDERNKAPEERTTVVKTGDGGMGSGLIAGIVLAAAVVVVILFLVSGGYFGGDIDSELTSGVPDNAPDVTIEAPDVEAPPVEGAAPEGGQDGGQDGGQ